MTCLGLAAAAAVGIAVVAVILALIVSGKHEGDVPTGRTTTWGSPRGRR